MTPRITNAVLAVKMDNITDRMDALAHTVEDHDKILRGNGRQGLLAGQAANTKVLNSMVWWVRFVAAAVVVDIIGRIMGLI